jgi:hypothetical protein
MYVSQSVRGARVAVTGVVIVPERPAPADGVDAQLLAHPPARPGDAAGLLLHIQDQARSPLRDLLRILLRR